MTGSREQRTQRPGTYLPFYLRQWQLQVSDTEYRLQRTFALKDAIEARRFAARVLQIGNDLRQIPTMYVYKRWVCVVWRVIRPDGLHIGDCPLPTSLNDLYDQWNGYDRRHAA